MSIRTRSNSACPGGRIRSRSSAVIGFAIVMWTTFAWDPNPLLSSIRSERMTAQTMA